MVQMYPWKCSASDDVHLYEKVVIKMKQAVLVEETTSDHTKSKH